MNPKTRKERFIVIGGCAAGMSAASKAKRLNSNLDVLALEKTAHVSYSACGIPYYVADLVREPSQLISITPDEFRRNRRIEVLTHHEVVEIDRTKRRVTAIELGSGGEQAFDYERLLIGVGGCPRKLDLPGAESKNVFTIQTLQDGIDLKTYVDQSHPQKAVIIGGGYIAMEMAEACRVRGLAVSVIEKQPQVLPGFERPITEVVESELVRNEVVVRTGTEVAGFESNTLGEVEATCLNNKQKVATDLVVVAIGLAPNTKLARMAGVRLGKTGAIAVDRKMQTSISNIYAAGDCVEVRNLVSGKADYIPLGPTANKQGRVAGENIGGGTATFRGVVGTSVFKTFELEVARTGLGSVQAAHLDIDVGTATIQENSAAGYYSGTKPITVTVIFDKRSGRLLGAQMVGKQGVSKRIDIFATALTNRMTLDEMAYLDLSYAPPFAPVWDPILVAINVARSQQ